MRTLRTIRDWAIGLLILCVVAYFIIGSATVFCMVLGYDVSPIPAAVAMACGFPCAFAAFAAWMAMEITGIRHPEAKRALLSDDERVFEAERGRINKPLP